MKLTEKISTSFAGLSPREQRLLGILGVVAVLALSMVFVFYLYNTFSELEERISRAEALGEELQRDKEKLVEKFAVSPVQSRDPVPRLTTFLEEISRRREVSVQNYGGEKEIPSKDKRYVETQMEVRLSRVTIEQTLRFLEEIENAPEAAYTKQLDISVPRKDQRDSLDVTILVATFLDTKAKKKAEDEKGEEDKKEEEKQEVGATAGSGLAPGRVVNTNPEGPLDPVETNIRPAGEGRAMGSGFAAPSVNTGGFPSKTTNVVPTTDKTTGKTVSGYRNMMNKRLPLMVPKAGEEGKTE
jgi:hypothetical protein